MRRSRSTQPSTSLGTSPKLERAQQTTPRGVVTVTTTQQAKTLLGARPTATSWLELCRWLDQISEATFAELLPRLEVGLSTWSDEHRVAPPHWVSTLLERRRDPRLRLARVLHLGALGNLEALTLARALDHIKQLRVTHLDLSGLPIAPRDLLSILLHPALEGLERLDMVGTFGEGEELYAAIARSSQLASLVSLDLSHTNITDAGAAVLAAGRFFGKLESLALRNANPDARLTCDGALMLSSSPTLSRLRRLDLTGHAIGDRGTRAIAESPYLQSLEELHLFANAELLEPALPEGRLPKLLAPAEVFTGPWPALVNSSNGRLGRLRELLFAAPRQPTWHAVCDLFNDWPDNEDLELGLSYATPHLDTWPDVLRRAPWHWNQTLLGPEPDRRLALCRHVEIEPQRVLTEDRFDHLRAQWKRFGFTALTLVGFDVDAERSCLQRLELPAVHHLALPRHFAGGLSVLRAALNASAFAELRSLDLRYSQVGPALVDALCKAPATPGLEVLQLDAANIGSSIARLADADLRSLRSLGLNGIRVGPDAMDRLLNEASLDNLEHLRASHNPLGYDAIVPLLKNDLLPSLRSLELRDANLDLAALEALCRAPVFKRLRALDIGVNRVGDAGVGAIVSASSGALVELGLVSTNLGHGALDALQRLPHLLDLVSLDLGHNAIKDDGVLALSRVPWNRLENLRLSRALVGDLGAIIIAESPRLATLIELDLERNRITDRGATALLRSPHLLGIRWLSLVQCKLGQPHLDSLEGIRPLQYGLEPRYAPPEYF